MEVAVTTAKVVVAVERAAVTGKMRILRHLETCYSGKVGGMTVVRDPAGEVAAAEVERMTVQVDMQIVTAGITAVVEEMMTDTAHAPTEDMIHVAGQKESATILAAGEMIEMIVTRGTTLAVGRVMMIVEEETTHAAGHPRMTAAEERTRAVGRGIVVGTGVAHTALADLPMIAGRMIEVRAVRKQPKAFLLS